MRYRDRTEAGRRLATLVEHLRAEDPIVLGLPRGGVPVAAEVARALGAPLDVIVVRKLGVPFQPELAMGAVGEDGVRVLNEEVVRHAGVSQDDIAAVEARERAELESRAVRFRRGQPALPLEGRTVIVIDDGIATGATARAALEVARAHGARKVVLAVPVAPPETATTMEQVADEVVCAQTPRDLWAVGAWYRDFSQTTDDEVVRLREQARRDGGGRNTGGETPPAVSGGAAGPPMAHDTEVTIAVDGLALEGHVTVPEGTSGIVVFAHGSGSSRHSPRNRWVASALQDRGLATLLFDLLTPAEERDRANVFDVELLATRLGAAARWCSEHDTTRDLALGYFGASTGAAAALWAAADDPRVRAVVSRGGRPDLAMARLPHVSAPTLLIVGGRDDVVLGLNHEAAAELGGPHRLEVVPGATHLFEEPGALDDVARLASDWFAEHLGPRRG